MSKWGDDRRKYIPQARSSSLIMSLMRSVLLLYLSKWMSSFEIIFCCLPNMCRGLRFRSASGAASETLTARPA
jgi:hypothetical protein